jgi:hypothetical protein
MPSLDGQNRKKLLQRYAFLIGQSDSDGAPQMGDLPPPARFLPIQNFQWPVQCSVASQVLAEG